MKSRESIVRPVVLIPSYNPGPVLRRTVETAMAWAENVWVVVDGSTDDSAAMLTTWARQEPRLRVTVRPINGGKGTAILDGARAAQKDGFTHALLMDSDGQHPAEAIPEFFTAAKRAPQAMILGQPIFDETVPRVRLYGRQLSVGLAWLEVLGPWVGDPLFGFRLYPIAPLLAVLAPAGRGRRYDFDHESLVRLYWAGVPAIKIPATCRYLSAEEGGVSHFHYVRDNLRLIALHLRLFPGWLRHLPGLCFRSRPNPVTT